MMAMFGNLFGFPQFSGTPGIGDGIPGNHRMNGGIVAPSLESLGNLPDTGNASLTAPMQAPKKPGAFSKDGTGWKILGILGDALASAGGGQATYMPAMLDLQQQAEKERQFQQQLAAKAAEANQPTAEMRNFQYYQQLDPNSRKTYSEMHRGDPYVNMTLPNGQIYSGPASGMASVLGGGSSSPAPQPGHVEGGYQFTGGNPGDPKNWKPVGGQPAGTRPFVSGSNLDTITALAESGGDPRAVSPKGARGLMQVMPQTAANPGFGIRPSNGSAEDDVRVGREYRRAMQARYGGDLAKMWGAYNWGPGRVDRAASQFGDNWLNAAPAETQNYIARNLRAVRGN